VKKGNCNWGKEEAKGQVSGKRPGGGKNSLVVGRSWLWRYGVSSNKKRKNLF